MKKGSKLIDVSYSVEIRDLASNTPFSTSGSSLRELLKVVTNFVPTMDNYSKVYREMRTHVGVYVGLFTLPSPGKKLRQVVVTISSDTISQADIDRFHAHASTLPLFIPSDLA
jgi:hypothetical protein